eukprot:gnl/TRDRNA2_/TRDRNA2_176267_c0_seq1.p1 gnl/TRDRNA2_/TRDRNA2_176267_c0~~gnl/TRDRNA2_/TRDRNA2_176267_c0_seq1.p1  ORF type:complete len:443 (-),score=92.05 gnl/TRDRNA2_/TRDRNA2_176267_c0_seq1:90-1418(-)
MMAKKPMWEPAWCSQRQRWYYQDRATGKSQWLRPEGFTGELPPDPVPDPDIPEEPKDLPPNWCASLDRANKRWYYYNTQTKVRQWFRPRARTSEQAAEVDESQITTQGASVSVKKQLQKQQKEVKDNKNATSQIAAKNRLASDFTFLWDAETFKHRLLEARQVSDKKMEQSVLAEVHRCNVDEVKNEFQVPRTFKVTPPECAQARKDGLIKDYGADPQVSFSHRTTADALVYFAGRDRRRVVCALSFANGSSVGGGVATGAATQEEDLCRRIPAFYPSLQKAKEAGHYPFGPVASPERYTDVLFTPGLTLARGGEDEGFCFFNPEKQVKVSIVSAAAPNVRASAGDTVNRKQMYETVKAIFMAGPLKEPQATTLIIGAWGCSQGNDPQKIAELFIHALLQDKLGRLYHEVHFAIPKTSPDDKTADIFRELLRKAMLPVIDLK